MIMLTAGLVYLTTAPVTTTPSSTTVNLMTDAVGMLGDFEDEGWSGYACTFSQWTACINTTTVSNCTDRTSPCLKCNANRGDSNAHITCALVGEQTQYHFPPGGVFPVMEQFHLPPNTAIVGAANPNANGTVSLFRWCQQTFWLEKYDGK
jgi:hypothetical protein